MHQLSRQYGFLTRVPQWSRGLSYSRTACAKLDLKPPPPGPPPPPPTNFDAPSRPRLVHERPKQRELPVMRSRAPALIGLGILGVTAWAGFVVYATNQERLASSVTRQVLTQVRASQEIAAELGPGVVAEPTWWMVGQPSICCKARLISVCVSKVQKERERYISRASEKKKGNPSQFSDSNLSATTE
ncbi:unnamed protein product [Rhizoctonia solani]|uniref:Uncharacterized protein n=1 Tax=Rhizoctonia solani TaxID=456999 RepID=A0A8H2WT80_9AGAM|nr:unnamed protein product [Rhizoctonia solani]